MSLETLLKERDSLRGKIETRRKQNESVLISIKGFLERIKEYMKFCGENDIRTDCVHVVSGNTYIIKCNKSEFKLEELDEHKRLVGCHLHFEKGEISSCSVGYNPSLKSITGTNGFLTPNAEWFRDNMETILTCLDAALEECVKNQIDEAKQLLSQ